MCFCEDHYVDVIGFHMVYDGVNFGWFPQACDIPLAYPEFVSWGDFDVMRSLWECLCGFWMWVLNQ